MDDQPQINAWTGEGLGASGAPAQDIRRRATRVEDTFPPQPGMAAAPEPPDDRDWYDVRLGWGLSLAEEPGAGSADRARAIDAHPAVRRLLDARPGSPVFRYDPALGEGYLRRRWKALDAEIKANSFHRADALDLLLRQGPMPLTADMNLSNLTSTSISMLREMLCQHPR